LTIATDNFKAATETEKIDQDKIKEKLLIFNNKLRKTLEKPKD
jgi:hypothetical protein